MIAQPIAAICVGCFVGVLRSGSGRGRRAAVGGRDKDDDAG